MSKLILNELSKEGQNIRKAYQRRLPSNTSKDYYFMQRDTGNIEAVTVEYGFLDSNSDDVSQLKNNWENYAEAVVRGITQYLNIPYVATPGDNYYTVKSGDSLWNIAKKYGVSVSELKDANNLTSSLLGIGQVLKIPSINETITTYIVKSGDNLYKIANANNTTVSEIMNLNNLSTTNLSIGQVLKISDVKETNATYIVKSGDNLYKIAKAKNTTVSEIMNLNNLSTTNLSIGQVLKIPSVKETNTTYIVKPGDNLYKIANQYNTTVNEIMSLNNLSTTNLSIGQVLKLK